MGQGLGRLGRLEAIVHRDPPGDVIGHAVGGATVPPGQLEACRAHLGPQGVPQPLRGLSREYHGGHVRKGLALGLGVVEDEHHSEPGQEALGLLLGLAPATADDRRQDGYALLPPSDLAPEALPGPTARTAGGVRALGKDQ